MEPFLAEGEPMNNDFHVGDIIVSDNINKNLYWLVVETVAPIIKGGRLGHYRIVPLNAPNGTAAGAFTINVPYANENYRRAT